MNSASAKPEKECIFDHNGNDVNKLVEPKPIFDKYGNRPDNLPSTTYPILTKKRIQEVCHICRGSMKSPIAFREKRKVYGDIFLDRAIGAEDHYPCDACAGKGGPAIPLTELIK